MDHVNQEGSSRFPCVMYFKINWSPSVHRQFNCILNMLGRHFPQNYLHSYEQYIVNHANTITIHRSSKEKYLTSMLYILITCSLVLITRGDANPIFDCCWRNCRWLRVQYSFVEFKWHGFSVKVIAKSLVICLIKNLGVSYDLDLFAFYLNIFLW